MGREARSSAAVTAGPSSNPQRTKPSVDDRGMLSGASSYMVDDAVVDTGSQRARYTAYQRSIEEENIPLANMSPPRHRMSRENSIVAEMLSENSALQVLTSCSESN